jgi:hypothetical protein
VLNALASFFMKNQYIHHPPKIIFMQVFTTPAFKISDLTIVGSQEVRCFTETPRKTGEEKPVPRMNAFDLFSLFTAEIIRRKEVFTR